jgi:hypothetical protein
MYKASSSESMNQNQNHQRINYLRVTVLLCLAGIGGGGGFLVFYLLNQMEDEICKLQFVSVADLIQASITANFESKVRIGHDLAKEFGVGCPSIDSWPYCPYEIDVLNYLNHDRGGNARLLGFAPFVSPEQILEYENWTQNFFNTTPGYPPGTGYSSTFGFGVFGLNNSIRYHDNTGLTSYGSSYQLVVPILLNDNLPVNYVALMFNLHSEKRRGVAIDRLLDCDRSFSSSSSSSSSRAHASSSSCHCHSTLTDMLYTYMDNNTLIQTTAIYSPIYPPNNPDKLVGLAYVYVYWDEIMNISIPSSFPEIIVVVKSDTTEIAYSFNHGRVIPLNSQDAKHNSNYYHHLKKSHIFTSQLVDPNTATYHLVVHPTSSFCEYYHSSGPLLVFVGLVCMMIITAVLFALYDYFMKSESLLRKFLLESKRLFVRFISHELRTPLSAVSLGLTLIETDLNSLLTHPIYSIRMPTELMEQLHRCIHSIHDASDNTDTAITVLNDMLQYDKIESKSLQCECLENDMWEIIRHVCRELSLQAKAQQLSFKMNLQVDLDENDESWKVLPLGSLERLKSSIVVGDPIKLGQVIRNLISNALKFSPPEGVVTVNGQPLFLHLSLSLS